MVWKNGHLFQRFAYEEAQYIIETKDDTIQKKFRLLELHIKFQQKLLLQQMDELAKILRKQEWLMDNYF
jgi:ribonuclease R